MTIYRSHVPDLDLGEGCGLFTYAFRNSYLYNNDAPAFIDAVCDERYSRKELHDLCLRFAYGVKQKGVKRGEVAMVFSPNALGFPIALLGLAAAGVKATLANSSYLPTELAHQLKNSRAGLVFVHPALLDTLLKTFGLLGVLQAEAVKRVVILSYTGPEKEMERALKIGPQWTRLEDFVSQGKLVEEEKFTGEQVHDSIMLCYSSGTTGLSKGVETTHSNLQAVTQTLQPFFRDIKPNEDIALSLLPFFHIYGVSMILLYQLRLGVPQVVMTRFEPVLFCSTIAKYGITVSCIVPPILVVLLQHPAAEQHDLSTLKWLSSGAAPLGLELVQRVKERFRKLGNEDIVVTQGYGLTETSPATHLLPAELSISKAGSIGYLVPNMEARLVDDDGKDAPVGPKSSGELWLRGPLIMKGYLHNEKATKESITPDGWFKTGDVAVRDNEGLYYIVDRKKELIKYKGFQVPPADLEAVLLSNPEIADAAVIGIHSSAQATELPRAYVVSTKNSHLLKNPSARKEFEKGVQEWIKTRVAQHKFLRGGVVVLEAIPKSATGKILRKDLRVLAEREAKEKEAQGVARL